MKKKRKYVMPEKAEEEDKIKYIEDEDEDEEPEDDEDDDSEQEDTEDEDTDDEDYEDVDLTEQKPKPKEVKGMQRQQMTAPKTDKPDINSILATFNANIKYLAQEIERINKTIELLKLNNIWIQQNITNILKQEKEEEN